MKEARYKLLERSQRSADFQVGCIAGFQARRSCEPGASADLEIGDTAGLETCATSPKPHKLESGQIWPKIKRQAKIRPNQTKKVAAPAAICSSHRRVRRTSPYPAVTDRRYRRRPCRVEATRRRVNSPNSQPSLSFIACYCQPLPAFPRNDISSLHLAKNPPIIWQIHNNAPQKLRFSRKKPTLNFK